MESLLNVATWFLLYISIPLLIRFAFLKKPIENKWITFGILLLLFIVFGTIGYAIREQALMEIAERYGIAYERRPHLFGSVPLYLSMFVSYFILTAGRKIVSSMHNRQVGRKEGDSIESRRTHASSPPPQKDASGMASKATSVGGLYCSQCGIKAQAGANFCSYCGTPLPAQLPSDTIVQESSLGSARSMDIVGSAAEITELRKYAGNDTATYAYATDKQWVCVCGTINQLFREKAIQNCSNCHRNRDYVLERYQTEESKKQEEKERTQAETVYNQSDPAIAELRKYAGSDANTFAYVSDNQWVCVCGTANQLFKEKEIQNCSKCHRNRDFVLDRYRERTT